MVQSSSISITPAQHADNHRSGGTDELTGNVDIDIEGYSMSPDVYHNNDSEVSDYTRTGTWIKVKEMSVDTLLLDGVVRVGWEHKCAVGGYTVDTRLYVNGAPIGVNHPTSSTAYAAVSDDISISSGDLIQVYVKTDAAEGVLVKNFRAYGAVISFGFVPVFTNL